MSESSHAVRDVVAVALARRAARDGSARSLRVRSRLSLAEVAAACGVCVSTVSKWERGIAVPSGAGARRYAVLLAGLLGVEE